MKIVSLHNNELRLTVIFTTHHTQLVIKPAIQQILMLF